MVEQTPFGPRTETESFATGVSDVVAFCRRSAQTPFTRILAAHYDTERVDLATRKRSLP